MFFKMLLSSLIRRKSRMTVALLAVAIGAAVLVGMISISRDIPRQMRREFRGYGANMIFVPAEGARLDVAEAKRAADIIPSSSLIGMTPYRYETVRINMQGYTAVGVDLNEASKTSPYWNVSGGYPAGANEVLIGYDIAEFTKFAPGAVLTVTGTSVDGTRFSRDFSVSGILNTGSVEDGFIFMPIDTLWELAGDSGQADLVEVSAALGEDELTSLVSAIKNEVPSISPSLVKRVTQSETTVLTKLQSLVYLVSAVTLVLTMICVATTMMTVVMERRKEIGLKKALGASNDRIAAEFMGEGAILGIAGGALGAVLGYLFAQAVSLNVFGRTVSMDWYLPICSLLVSVIVTMAACLLPVRRAVLVDPALVLRGE
jgi:putative ABC transport system permease protein